MPETEEFIDENTKRDDRYDQDMVEMVIYIKFIIEILMLNRDLKNIGFEDNFSAAENLNMII